MLITQRAKLFKYNGFLKSGEDADFLVRYLKGGTYYLDPNILTITLNLTLLQSKKF